MRQIIRNYFFPTNTVVSSPNRMISERTARNIAKSAQNGHGYCICAIDSEAHKAH